LGEDFMGEKNILVKNIYIFFEYYENSIGIPQKSHKIIIKII
jgi:hypothetical protein